jgi:hypothetical protein
MLKPEYEKVFQNYIIAAIAHGKATIEGDYKTANKQYVNLEKIYKKFERDHSLADNLVEIFFQNVDPSVRIWAAAHALKLNIRVDEAKKVLQQASGDNNIGIFRLDAEMTLKEWEKKE